MKFSDLTKEQWDENAEYFDTCLLPVTGLSGMEKPYEATEELEWLRDLLDLIEIPFKGRVVTYPACHYYIEHPDFTQMLEHWCASLKKTGFRYVIVASADRDIVNICPSIDYIVQPDLEGKLPKQAEVSDAIRELWSGQGIKS